MNNEYKRLDVSKIVNRKINVISSKEALKDITPINWTETVVNEEKKVLIKTYK